MRAKCFKPEKQRNKPCINITYLVRQTLDFGFTAARLSVFYALFYEISALLDVDVDVKS